MSPNAWSRFLGVASILIPARRHPSRRLRPSLACHLSLEALEPRTLLSTGGGSAELRLDALAPTSEVVVQPEPPPVEVVAGSDLSAGATEPTSLGPEAEQKQPEVY